MFASLIAQCWSTTRVLLSRQCLVIRFWTTRGIGCNALIVEIGTLSEDQYGPFFVQSCEASKEPAALDHMREPMRLSPKQNWRKKADEPKTGIRWIPGYELRQKLYAGRPVATNLLHVSFLQKIFTPEAGTGWRPGAREPQGKSQDLSFQF